MRPASDTALRTALAVSIACHVFAAAAAAYFRPRSAPAATTRPALRSMVELEYPAVTEEPPVVVEPDPEEPEPEAESAATVARVGAQARMVDPGLPGEVEPGLSDPPADTTGQTDTAERPRRDPATMQLDPRTAALSSLGLAPHVPAPQAQPDPDAEDGQGIAGAARSHEDFLRAEARRRPAVTRRGPPRLQRGSDGSYSFNGHAFSARIDRDGQVHFEERRRLAYDRLGGGSSVSVSTSFDLMDGAMRRHGEDPYGAERRWFMRETRELREGLQDEARERDRRRAIGRLRARLRRVWETTERTPSARRGRIFRIWDGLAENDADGDAARRAVIAWVRANLPAGGPDAYTPAELSSFNGRRESSGRFAPY